MTAQKRHKLTCPHCQGEVEDSTPFSLWLRGLPAELSSAHNSLHNIDYVWHFYKSDTVEWFILIEEKRNGVTASSSQKDTHLMVAEMLKIASAFNPTVEKSFRRKKKKVQFRGYYEVSFENTTPLDSKWVKIDGQMYIEPETIIKHLLTYGHPTKKTYEPLIEKAKSVISEFMRSLAIEQLKTFASFLITLAFQLGQASTVSDENKKAS